MSTQVGLGIGNEDRLGEAISAFTSVQEPKVDLLDATAVPYLPPPACGT